MTTGSDDRQRIRLEYGDPGAAGSRTPEGRPVQFDDASGAPSDGSARCRFADVEPAEIQVFALER